MEEYPNDDELRRVREWPPTDLSGLMDFVRSIWWQPDWGWNQVGENYRISTGGWSGNEELIEALKGNTMFWMLCWQSSRRGGHYEFRVPAARLHREPEKP